MAPSGERWAAFLVQGTGLMRGDHGHLGHLRKSSPPRKRAAGGARVLFLLSRRFVAACLEWVLELELELIQAHMAQKPMLREEVQAQARPP